MNNLRSRVGLRCFTLLLAASVPLRAQIQSTQTAMPIGAATCPAVTDEIGFGWSHQGPANIRDMWRRVFAWFDEFFKVSNEKSMPQR